MCVQLLVLGYALRLVSGLLHATACAVPTSISFAGFGVPLLLLLLSRIVHGYTILVFPLSVVWIGAREKQEEKAPALATRNAFSTIGIFLGIVSGARHCRHRRRTRLACFLPSPACCASHATARTACTTPTTRTALCA